jgi:hypothetical protein
LDQGVREENSQNSGFLGIAPAPSSANGVDGAAATAPEKSPAEADVQDLAPPRRNRSQTLGQVAEIIRETAAAHPDWSSKRIAKHLGQPLPRVERALGRNSNGGAV